MTGPRARLEDGRVVVLAKDCDCPDHVGPHWLAWDARRRAEHAAAMEATCEAMERPQLPLIEVFRLEARLNALAAKERVRLEIKARNLRVRGIAELLPEEGEGPCSTPSR